MRSLRIALGIRNNHHVGRNLLYYAYQRYARLRSNVSPSDRDEEIARELARTGIARVGVTDVAELSRVVESQLAAVTPVNGYAGLPRRHNPLLVPHLYRMLREMRGPIEAYFGSHFRVNWFEAQKIVPGAQPPGSSFDYHTDDVPLPVIKLFIYLTDCEEATGAFRAFDYRRTDELLRRGMLESAFPGARRAQAQLLVRPEAESELTVVEGPKGTVFMFDNNLVHKGTLPRRGHRVHVSMELMPSPEPQTEQALMRDCDKEIAEYFPRNPFRRRTH